MSEHTLGQAEQQPDALLPPGQHWLDVPRLQHYGPVPRFKPDSWKLSVMGALATPGDVHLSMDDFCALNTTEVIADMHCVTRWSVPGLIWGGVPAHELLRVAPPAPQVTHVVAWAEYGYSTNMLLADFIAAGSLLATHVNGEQLTPERGYPLRLVVPHLYAWKGPKWLRAIEYVVGERRGFWEERGYHTHGRPWHEERYSYLE